jgi:hypothetical protein
MLFSDAFGIQRTDQDDWFDPLLNLDTKLFIDPFLLYDHEAGEFVGSHAEVIRFFNHVLTLIARSGGNQSSASWRQAASLLRLPEVEELCLGYTSLGTRGSGSGQKLARQLAGGLLRAVRAGIMQLTHFEEVQIFEEGIGADRISDATANLARHRLAQYTVAVCGRHGVELHPMQTDRGVFDEAQGRWVNRTFPLPRNPINGKPIMLVPRRYLRRLPTINPGDFWDYCFDNHNETLRQRYGDDVTRNANKATIVDLARAQPGFRKEYVRAKEAEGTEAYDLDQDANGLYQPAAQASRWARAHPRLVQPQSDAELAAAVIAFVEEFRNYVENQTGWRLLWNDSGTPKNEDSFQALFMQTVAAHCRANNIDVTAEANIGRGPVDFRMSLGYRARVLVEAKLARNTRFRHGLERQLPKYLEAEGVSEGLFVVCVHSDEDIEKLQDINRRVAALNAKLPYRVRAITVDARAHPPSASHLPNEPSLL